MDDDDAYDSIDEDAELELSCALHDLAQRVKTFEESMKGRFRAADGEGDDDEISEEIPEMDEPLAASPKRAAHRGGRCSRRRSAKQQDNEDDDSYDDEEEDEEEDEEDEDRGYKQCQRRRRRNDEHEQKAGEDWGEQEEKEELSELRQNIALLLQGIKAEASALNGKHEQAAVQEHGDNDDGNQAIWVFKFTKQKH